MGEATEGASFINALVDNYVGRWPVECEHETSHIPPGYIGICPKCLRSVGVDES